MVTAARVRLAEGRPLVIFPEGTRVPHGERPALRSGFAGLYKLLGQPVVPVAIDSGPTYHRRWKRKGTIRIRVGEPIPPGLPREEIEARVHAAINALHMRNLQPYT
jgi:1-acyl-sn-glycerol-3-phosphate acyltransferase